SHDRFELGASAIKGILRGDSSRSPPHDVLGELAHGTQVNPRLTGRVVKAQFVPPPGRVGAETALRLLLRHRERQRMLRIVDAPDHDWLVRVAGQKLHQYLHTDARNKLRAPSAPSPRLGDPNPAR